MGKLLGKLYATLVGKKIAGQELTFDLRVAAYNFIGVLGLTIGMMMWFAM